MAEDQDLSTPLTLSQESGFNSPPSSDNHLEDLDKLLPTENPVEGESETPNVLPESNPVKPAETPSSPVTPAQPAQAQPTEGTPSAAPVSALDQILEPKSLSASGRQGWKALKTAAYDFERKAVAETQRAAQLETELKAIQSKPQTIPENIQNQLRELLHERSVTMMQKDPDFVEKYDKKIDANTNKVYDLISGAYEKKEVGDQIVEGLKKNGGLWGATTPDGTPYLSSKLWQDVLGFYAKADPLKRVQLDKFLNDAAALSAEKAERIAEMPTKVSEWNKQQIAQYEEKAKQEWNALQTAGTKLQQDNPWAQYQKPKGNETSEQLKGITDHNKKVDNYLEVWNFAANARTAEQKAQVYGACVAAFRNVHIIEEQNAIITQLNERLAHLEGESTKVRGDLANVRKAGSTSRLGASVPAQGSKPIYPSGFTGNDGGLDKAFEIGLPVS